VKVPVIRACSLAVITTPATPWVSVSEEVPACGPAGSAAQAANGAAARPNDNARTETDDLPMAPPKSFETETMSRQSDPYKRYLKLT
jgi:hypothetical protein